MGILLNPQLAETYLRCAKPSIPPFAGDILKAAFHFALSRFDIALFGLNLALRSAIGSMPASCGLQSEARARGQDSQSDIRPRPSASLYGRSDSATATISIHPD
jgi:hypothetical protein